MRLLEFVATLEVETLSRLVIETGPGRSTVTATFAQFGRKQAGVYPDGDRFASGPLRGPQRIGEHTPPAATLSTWMRVDDATGKVDSADMPGQLGELRDSGIIGGINVEPLGQRKLVVSAHAATQEERNAWLIALRSISRT